MKAKNEEQIEKTKDLEQLSEDSDTRAAHKNALVDLKKSLDNCETEREGLEAELEAIGSQKQTHLEAIKRHEGRIQKIREEEIGKINMDRSLFSKDVARSQVILAELDKLSAYNLTP